LPAGFWDVMRDVIAREVREYVSSTLQMWESFRVSLIRCKLIREEVKQCLVLLFWLIYSTIKILSLWVFPCKTLGLDYLHRSSVWQILE
jgi:hypothetical protein